MTHVQILKKLNTLLDQYETAIAYTQKETRIGTALHRMEKIDLEYIAFCEKHKVYLFTDLPYHIRDIYDYEILIEEIRLGTLFLD